MYLGLAAALGGTVLGRVAASMPAALGTALRVATVVAPIALIAAGLVLGLLLFHEGMAARAQRLATRATAGRVAAALGRWRAGSAAVDGRIRLLLGRSGGTDRVDDLRAFLLSAPRPADAASPPGGSSLASAR